MRKEKLSLGEKAALVFITAATVFGTRLGLAPKAIAEENLKATGVEQEVKLSASELQTLSDISTSNPYFMPIKSLAERGIISGFDDGTFCPEKLITRQQFVKMFVRALGLPVSEQNVCTFKDVPNSGPNDLYPDNYIAAAKTAGLVEGITTEIFAPDEIVTKKQAITVFMRELKKNYPDYLGSSPSNYEVFFEQPIIDIQLPSQNQPNGLIVMLGPELRAQEQLSRGSAALFVYNVSKMISAFQSAK